MQLEEVESIHQRLRSIGGGTGEVRGIRRGVLVSLEMVLLEPRHDLLPRCILRGFPVGPEFPAPGLAGLLNFGLVTNRTV